MSSYPPFASTSSAVCAVAAVQCIVTPTHFSVLQCSSCSWCIRLVNLPTYLELDWVHPASRWLHWDTHRRHFALSFVRQYLGFFPGQVSILEVSFDDIYPVLPWSSWFSLVTSQFPVRCLTSCSGVVHSQYVSKPSEPSSLIISSSFREPVFFLMYSFLTLSLHVIANSLLWNLWWAASSFLFVWQRVAMIVHHTVGLRWRHQQPTCWRANSPT